MLFRSGETGVAWVLYGPVVGATDADDVVDRVLGEVRGDGVGLHLTTGALTGNPYADLLVGATTRDSAATDAGAIYLVEGGPGL